MLRSSSRGWNTKLWAICGVLAIVSLSLVLAAGCASGAGGSPAQTQLSGSAKVHTYNAAPDADVAARFFYSNVSDDQGTPWKEHRMVWSTADTTPSAAIGKIGIETAEPPEFIAVHDPSSNPPWTHFAPHAKFYIVNNWDKPITVTGMTIPDGDFYYEAPPSGEFATATTPKGEPMYDWLNALLPESGDHFDVVAKLLFGGPPGHGHTPDEVDEIFAHHLSLAQPVNGTRHAYLESALITPPHIASPGSSAVIPPNSRSEAQGEMILKFSGWDLTDEQATSMITLAFSTYFGVTVDFTYTP